MECSHGLRILNTLIHLESCTPQTVLSVSRAQTGVAEGKGEEARGEEGTGAGTEVQDTLRSAVIVQTPRGSPCPSPDSAFRRASVMSPVPLCSLFGFTSPVLA